MQFNYSIHVQSLIEYKYQVQYYTDFQITIIYFLWLWHVLEHTTSGVATNHRGV